MSRPCPVNQVPGRRRDVDSLAVPLDLPQGVTPDRKSALARWRSQRLVCRGVLPYNAGDFRIPRNCLPMTFTPCRASFSKRRDSELTRLGLTGSQPVQYVAPFVSTSPDRSGKYRDALPSTGAYVLFGLVFSLDPLPPYAAGGRMMGKILIVLNPNI